MENNINPLQAPVALTNTTKTEIPVPHEYSLKASERKIRGHQIFAWNPMEGTIVVSRPVVEVEIANHPINPKLPHSVLHSKVNQDKSCIYIQALNKENAAKRVLKIIAEVKLKQLNQK